MKETRGLNDKEKKSLYGPAEMMDIMPEVAAKWRDLSGVGEEEFFALVRKEKEIRLRLKVGLKKKLAQICEKSDAEAAAKLKAEQDNKQ